ncbi:Hypothetical predicted protein, partial [Mytilus galloprovincialis]
MTFLTGIYYRIALLYAMDTKTRLQHLYPDQGQTVYDYIGLAILCSLLVLPTTITDRCFSQWQQAWEMLKQRQSKISRLAWKPCKWDSQLVENGDKCSVCLCSLELNSLERCSRVSGYMYSEQFEIRYKFHEANISRKYPEYDPTCKNEGGELMKIDSEEKQQYAEKFL